MDILLGTLLFLTLVVFILGRLKLNKSIYVRLALPLFMAAFLITTSILVIGLFSAISEDITLMVLFYIGLLSWWLHYMIKRSKYILEAINR